MAARPSRCPSDNSRCRTLRPESQTIPDSDLRRRIRHPSSGPVQFRKFSRTLPSPIHPRRRRGRPTGVATRKKSRLEGTRHHTHSGLTLVIVHNHFRPGGVRRVIELATPALLATLSPRITTVMLLAGEEPDGPWLQEFRRSTGGVPVICAIHPAAGYRSGQRGSSATLARQLRLHLNQCIPRHGTEPVLIWAHNPGLGRNLLLTRALNAVCRGRPVRLLMHHHDWWFDNRWPRWPEMRRSGFRTLSAVARTLFPPVSQVRHIAINGAEASVLKRHLGAAVEWVPNPAERTPAVDPRRIRQARAWLNRHVPSGDPVWLLPCRLLRRKNVAEALLLTRWLRPEAWLVTTGPVSSPPENSYARRLETAARREGWRLRLGILAHATSHPPLPDLLAASEAVLLTSLQEGFGLPYVEAAAAGRPLIARSLPNVAPDLRRFGFRFPQGYGEIRVDPSLFDWPAEQRRQQVLFRKWMSGMPRACRDRVIPPVLLNATEPSADIAFSRLTLTAQLEVLRKPVEESWARCVPLNPFLAGWRERAATGRLVATDWPEGVERWLSVAAYARRIRNVVDRKIRVASQDQGPDCQLDLLETKLQREYLYPILWSPHT